MAWKFKKEQPVASPNAGKKLPAGMRNNNPGNIKFVGQRDAVGPSKNTDQGDPQAVYATPEQGMKAMYNLLRRKYAGGKTTPREMIAGDRGWTPGNLQAAKNVAKSAGIGLDDDINFGDPASAAKFMRGLVRQEHGPASDAYSDDLIMASIQGGPVGPAASTGRAHGQGGASLGVGVGGSNIEGGVPAAPEFDVANVDLAPTDLEMMTGSEGIPETDPIDEEEATLGSVLQSIEFGGFEGTEEAAQGGLERGEGLKDEILAMIVSGMEAQQGGGVLPRLPGFPQIEMG